MALHPFGINKEVPLSHSVANYRRDIGETAIVASLCPPIISPRSLALEAEPSVKR
jgi:hypothetical protein